MTLKESASILGFLTVSLNFMTGFALIHFESEELGAFLCWQIPENFNSCSSVEFDEWRLLVPGSYANITSPRIVIAANQGSRFDVTFKNGVFIRNTRVLLVMGEETAVDIELKNASTTYEIKCISFGSFSKLSTNIFMSAEVATRVARKASFNRISILSTSFVKIYNDEFQSGHFTCRLVDQSNCAEIFRIFTQITAPNDVRATSPFVPVPGLTIETDTSSTNRFILPCRTNYRIENPPDLLWRKQSESTFTTLTADEMKDFRWDPRVGFQFNGSKRMWEMENLACRSGNFHKTFLPTSARFQTSILIKSEIGQIGCVFAPHNDSSAILSSDLVNQKSFHRECNSFVACELLMESGTVLYESRDLREVELHNSSLYSMSSHGILSCYVEHVYEGKQVPAVSSRMFFVGLDSNVYLLPGSYPNSSVIQISQVPGPFYKHNVKLEHKFTCSVSSFLLSKAVFFKIRYTNLVEKFIGRKKPYISSVQLKSDFKVALETNITHVICMCLTQDGKVVSSERPLKFIDPYVLLIDNQTQRARTFKIGELNAYLTLSCPITAVRKPTYRWVLDANSSSHIVGVDTQNLTFRQIHENMAGTYTCEAANKYYSNSFEFEVSVEPQDSSSVLNETGNAWTAAVVVTCSSLLIVIVIFTIKYFKTKRQIRNLTPKEIAEFLNGIPDSDEASHAQWSEMAVNLPFSKCIEPSSLNVARDLILGKGQYGIVFRGTLHSEVVAVKSFNRKVTYDELLAGLREVKLLAFVGAHPNIVRFIGADVTNIQSREILIVMELSPFGSLQKHLKTLRPAVQTNYTSTAKSQYENVDKRTPLQKLFGFCEQIAFAMQYLESKKLIHGDLAARNVLVFNNDVVKLTDFGHSRQLVHNIMYKPEKPRAIAWRWGSIELLRQMEFSTESDIWAFGVTVWEIFTFGNVPFASEKWNEQFMLSLENGLRLKKPYGLSDIQYSFLKECWNVRKSARPRFLQLKGFFSMETKNLVM